MIQKYKNILSLLLMVCVLNISFVLQAQENTTQSQIDKLVSQESFSLSKDTFMSTYGRKNHFRWTSDKQESARTVKKGLSFKGFKSSEIIVEFKKDLLSRINIYLYNRGDDGNLSKGVFKERFEKIMTRFSTDLKVKAKKLAKKGASKKSSKMWITDKLNYKLDYKAGKVRGNDGGRKIWRSEYIRLYVTLGSAKLKKERDSYVRKKDLKSNLVTLDDGGIYIDNIPMVDQGQKGYCACAVASRLLKFYGRDIDQHEVAQMANSGSSTGTSQNEFRVALKKIASKTGLRFTGIQSTGLRELEKFIQSYNRNVRRTDISPAGDFLGGSLIDYYSNLDLKMMILTKTKKKSVVKKFTKIIVKNVNMGIPVIWSVYLGFVKEGDLPQSKGGHMRLIIGYNKAKKSIYYSDTWGSGHERKEMTIKNAMTITSALSLLKPR